MQNQPIQGLGSSAKPIQSGSKSDGAAFHALLEQLETRSKDLAQSSTSASDSADLAQAVDESEKALKQARQLTDQLLEAFRASQQRPSN